MLARLTLFTLLAAVIVTPHISEAQVIKHKVTPRVIDRDVEQRDIFTEEITIDNFGPNKVTVYPSINSVIVDTGGDIVDFSPPSMSDNRVTVTSWVEMSRAGIELFSGESTTLPLNIKIHPQAKPGVYHAFIGFGTGRNRDIAEKQVQEGIAPGVVLTLAVSQNNVEAIKLSDFFIKRFITKDGAEAASYTLKNPGTADIVPTGEIIISNNKGEETASIKVNPKNETLSPGETKVYVEDVPAANLLGKYKAFLTVDYGSDQVASVYDTAFFYVVPWKQILILFGIFAFVVILMTILIHRRYAKDDEDDEHGAAYIPVFIREQKTEDQHNDINLKGN